MNNIPVENTTIFKYLGCSIKYGEPSTEDSEREMRIDTAQCKFYEREENDELQNALHV